MGTWGVHYAVLHSWMYENQHEKSKNKNNYGSSDYTLILILSRHWKVVLKDYLISLRLSVEALSSKPTHLTLTYEKGSNFLITKSSHEWHTLHIIKINAVWLIYSVIKMCICLAWGLALGIHQWLGQADVYIIQHLIFVVTGFSSVVTLYLSKILRKWR